MCLANATMCLAMEVDENAQSMFENAVGINRPDPGPSGRKAASVLGLSIQIPLSNTTDDSFPDITPKAKAPRDTHPSMKFGFSNATVISQKSDAGEGLAMPTPRKQIASKDLFELAAKENGDLPPKQQRNQFPEGPAGERKFKSATKIWNLKLKRQNRKQENEAKAFNRAKAREGVIEEKLTFREDDRKPVHNGDTRHDIRRRLLTTQRLLNAEEAHATL